jgi:hypothetical protein
MVAKMTEHCISPDYELRGKSYELWTDGTWQSGGYPNWWLSDGKQSVDESDFEPPLSHKELRQICEYAYDRLSGA